MLIVAGAVSLGVRGLQRGIDFTGGRNYVVEFEQKVSPEQVKKWCRKPLMPRDKAVR